MSISNGDVWKTIADRMLAVQGMSDLSHAERTVLSVLAFHDGEKCCPALLTIAKRIGCSQLWVRDLLKSARAKGRITWTRRRRESSVYTINYEAPILECGESPRSSELRVRGIPAVKHRFLIAGNSREELKASKSKGAAMKNGTPIGWCRSCGFTRVTGDVGCGACGTEDEPFLCTEAELRSGVIALPFGIHATGCDTPEGRMLFLSEAGQRGLREAYSVVFGDAQLEGVMQ